MTLNSRLRRIENRMGVLVAEPIGCILRNIVSPDDPKICKPAFACILTGPNAGEKINRSKNETADQFQARVDVSLKEIPGAQET